MTFGLPRSHFPIDLNAVATHDDSVRIKYQHLLIFFEGGLTLLETGANSQVQK